MMGHPKNQHFSPDFSLQKIVDRDKSSTTIYQRQNMFSTRQAFSVSVFFAVFFSIKISTCIGDNVRCRRPRNCPMQIAPNDEWFPMLSGFSARRSKSKQIQSDGISRGKYIRSVHVGRLPNHYTNLQRDGVQVKTAKKNVLLERRDTENESIVTNRWSRGARLFNEPVPGEILFPPKVLLFKAQPLQSIFSKATTLSNFRPIFKPTTKQPRPTRPMFKIPKLYPFYEHEAIISNSSLFKYQRSPNYFTTTNNYSEIENNNMFIQPQNPLVKKKNYMESNKLLHFPPIVYANYVSDPNVQIEKPSTGNCSIYDNNYSLQRPIEYVIPTEINNQAEISIDKTKPKSSEIASVTLPTIEEMLDELMLTIPKKVNYHNPSKEHHQSEPTYRYHIGSMNDDNGILVPVTTKLLVKHPIFIDKTTSKRIASNHQWNGQYPGMVYQPTPRTIRKSLFSKLGGFKSLTNNYTISQDFPSDSLAQEPHLNNSNNSQLTSVVMPAQVTNLPIKNINSRNDRFDKGLFKNYGRREHRRNQRQKRRRITHTAKKHDLRNEWIIAPRRK